MAKKPPSTRFYAPSFTGRLYPETMCIGLGCWNILTSDVSAVDPGLCTCRLRRVLISSWIETSDTPNAWLSLDEHDNNLRQFLLHFLATIQTMFPDTVIETTTLANTSPLPPMSVLARSLANELDAIEQNFMLVLDDIHCIQEKSVYDLLTELLQQPQ